MTRISSAHPVAASAPFGTTITLALLLVVSDLTGKLPPSVMAERRRYYSGQNRQNNNYRQRSERGRQRTAESGGPGSGRRDQWGSVRRKLEEAGPPDRDMPLIPGGDVMERPMQPDGVDPSSASDGPLFTTTSSEMGGDEMVNIDKLFDDLYNGNVQLAVKDTPECERRCSGCGK